MKRVLFVCVGNSCRSQMAEGFARELGGDVMEPFSAGLAPAGGVADETVLVMDERGIDIRAHRPKFYEANRSGNFDLIVNLSGFELPQASNGDEGGGGSPPARTEWPVDDPVGASLEVHRRVRDEVETRIRGLIADLREHRIIPSHETVGQRIAPYPVRKPGLWQRFTRWL